MFCRQIRTVKLQPRHRFLPHQQQRLVTNSNRSASSNGPRNIFAGSWKLPATLGFAFIGFLQWQHLNHPTDEERKTHPAVALLRLPGSRTAFEATMATERQLQALKLFPYRAASRLWGAVHNKDLPTWLRAPVYKAWTAVFNCNLDEMKYSIQEYANLGEFFSRPLKDGVRPFDTVPGHLASPVDGTVASIGEVDDSYNVPTLEQIKGARYRLDEFLGGLPTYFSENSSASEGKKMFYCVLYLAPGDYHRIHAPVDWQVEQRRHFPGNLFPVNQVAARLIPSLFVENERVALLGEWEHGFFSLTAVGATNVGSVVITKEPAFSSNTVAQDQLVGQCCRYHYGIKLNATRGEEMAQFKAPESFRFDVKSGEKVILGRCIGKVAE
uniref:phosphatidylserine decarboxylase n=1 Tax=Hyaloperonospora arabidopsidis (strain Emoy2) TaxID=559515 RepID=M4BUM1_HYAAE